MNWQLKPEKAYGNFEKAVDSMTDTTKITLEEKIKCVFDDALTIISISFPCLPMPVCQKLRTITVTVELEARHDSLV